MGFKVIIVLLWLSVPVLTGLWLRADQQRFRQECASQRLICADRSAGLSRYAAQLARQGEQVGYRRDARELQQWRSEWQSLERSIERDLPLIDSAALRHCPATAAWLREQQIALGDLAEDIEEAARDQEYLVRGEVVLADLGAQLDNLGYQKEYYRRMPGGRGVYMFLQEELAKLEQRYYAQQAERERLDLSLRAHLADAQERERKLQSALANSGKLLDQDARKSYIQDVQDRWAAFDLRNELAAMLTRLARAQAR